MKQLAHSRTSSALNDKRMILSAHADRRTAPQENVLSRTADTSSRVVLLAQESERRRIARELHDEFGQRLTALRFDLAWLQKRLASQPPSLQTNLLLQKTECMEESVSALMQSVRTTATSLHPSILDDLGLPAALEWLINDAQKRTLLRCHLIVTAALTQCELTIESSTALYRIVQELLTNVVRHAQATVVMVTLDTRAGDLVVTVSDNGIGITLSRIEQVESFGLRGIRERVTMLNGTIVFTGEPGLGTTISIRLPRTTVTAE